MNVGDIPLVSVVTFTPLVGALIVAVAPGRYARPLALAASLVAWVASMFLIVGFEPASGRAFQFVEGADWIPAFGIQYKVGIDGLSLILVVLTTTISWISI